MSAFSSADCADPQRALDAGKAFFIFFKPDSDRGSGKTIELRIRTDEVERAVNVRVLGAA